MLISVGDGAGRASSPTSAPQSVGDHSVCLLCWSRTWGVARNWARRTDAVALAGRSRIHRIRGGESLALSSAARKAAFIDEPAAAASR